MGTVSEHPPDALALLLVYGGSSGTPPNVSAPAGTLGGHVMANGCKGTVVGDAVVVVAAAVVVVATALVVVLLSEDAVAG